MKRPPLTEEYTHASIRAISKQAYENQFNRFAYDASPLDEPFDDMPEDDGDKITTFTQRHYQTAQRLEGSTRTLNSQSIVRYQDFRAPLEPTRENCEAFLYHREVATVCFALIRIIEPGIMKPVKSDIAGVFIRDLPSLERPASVGITHALNGTLLDDDSHGAILHILHTTREQVSDIRRDEGLHVEQLLNELSFPSTH